MTDINQRIASLSPEKRALLEKRLAESRPTSNRAAPMEHTPTGEAVPSFGQEMLWTLEQIDRGTPQYNVCYALYLRGKIDVPALKNALAALVNRHETLRTRYIMSTSGQLLLEFPLVHEVPLAIADLSS